MTLKAQKSILDLMGGVASVAQKIKTIISAVSSGEIDPEKIQETIQSATSQAVQAVLAEVNSLEATDLLRYTDDVYEVANIRNTLSPNMKSAIEFFHTLYTLSEQLSVSGVSSLSGDDSIDIESTTSLEEGMEYVIQSGSVRETIIVSKILSSTRLRATAPISVTITNGTLTRTNWTYIGALETEGGTTLATAETGQAYYSNSINVDAPEVEDDTKSLIIRVDENAETPSVYYRSEDSDTWLEAVWFYRRATTEDGQEDIEYNFDISGSFEFKVVANSDTIFDFIMTMTSPSGLTRGVRNPPLAPTMGYPADEGTEIGEQPALTITDYSSPTGSSLRGAYFQVSTVEDDFSEENLVLNTGLSSGYSYTPAKDILQPSTTYYVRAKVEDEFGSTSEWSAVTSFTTKDTFVSIDAPSCTSPSAGEELGNPDSLTLVCSAFAYDGDEETHAASQWQIATDSLFANILLDSGEDTENLTSYTAADGTVEWGESYFWRVRHKGTTSGDWSDWSASTAFSVVALEHGARIDGGIAIGPYMFMDALVGYLVVAPASQRSALLAWGLYEVDVQNVYSLGSNTRYDPKTGESNTAVLSGDTYNSTTDSQGITGSPASDHCDDLSFEGFEDFFLPNIQELANIAANKSLIDSADDSGGSRTLAYMEAGGLMVWSSSEYSSVNARGIVFSSDAWSNGLKDNTCHAIPCRRHLLTPTAERVSGGIKIGPYPFADGEIGYLIVAPATQRTQLAWGLYATDVSGISNITYVANSDPNTGLSNTSILTSSSYNSIVDSYSNTGSPAATHCDTLTCEGKSDYFLPSKDELAFIIANMDAIDALDDSGGANTFAGIDTSYIWTSSEYTNTQAWLQRPSDGNKDYTTKNTTYYVVPCRREVV